MQNCNHKMGKQYDRNNQQKQYPERGLACGDETPPQKHEATLQKQIHLHTGIRPFTAARGPSHETQEVCKTKPNSMAENRQTLAESLPDDSGV